MPENLLDVSIEYFRGRPLSLGILIVATVYLCSWHLIIPKLRRKLSRSLLGETADEWPGLDRLLIPVIARAGIVDCESLVNHVLVDRPSKTTRALLSAYGIRVQRLALEMNEYVYEDGAPVTEDALRVALVTCAHARDSRPSVEKIDYSAMLVPMFSVPRLGEELTKVGLTKLKVTYYLSHLRQLPEVEDFGRIDPDSERVWVRIHNDRYSTESLVNRVLSGVFDCSAEAAHRITNDVQQFGLAHVGPYAPSDAMKRIKDATAIVRAAEEPLMLSLTTKTPAARAAPESASRESRNPYAVPKSTIDSD